MTEELDDVAKTSLVRKHVCVIGSGPAGMVASLELAARGCSVTLIESGFETEEQEPQKLSDAILADASAHAPMADAVHRRWGGTSHLWGGRCVPFNQIDFEPRPDLHDAVWPIPFESLSTHLTRACAYADCGEAVFSAKALSDPFEYVPLSEKFVDGVIRSDSLERWSGSPVMVHRLGALIAQHPRIQRLVGHTCIRVIRDDQELVAAVVLVDSLGRSPNERRVEADTFVLACGGVETTRILLHSCSFAGDLRVDGRVHLGRYYMGHLSGKIASIRLFGDPRRTVYGFERDGAHYVRRRLALTDEALREAQLLNIAFWLDNPPPSDATHGSGVLSAAYLAMKISCIGKRLAPNAIRKALIGGQQRTTTWSHVRNVLRTLPSTSGFVLNFLYTRYLCKPRIPGFFVFSATNTYALHFHAEQLPSAESQITLSAEADALGVPRAAISLRYCRKDAESVVAAHAVLDSHLRANGIGELMYSDAEEKRVDAVLSQARDGFHQIGTTRMGRNADHGVTDGFGRVFGSENLFVCSSSVFPTSSQANPTLTLLAFAIHQAEHISGAVNPS